MLTVENNLKIFQYQIKSFLKLVDTTIMLKYRKKGAFI